MSADDAPSRLSSLASDERVSFIASMKKHIRPVLAHQFEVAWPWPSSAAPEEALSDNAGRNDTGSAEGSRRYGRATHVVSLTAESRRPSAYGTRRVALLLSPGTRFRLPLLRAETAPEDSGSRASARHPVYWQVPYRPAAGAPTAAPPACAEVVVGEVRAIDVAMRRRREQHTRRTRQGEIPAVLSRVVVAGPLASPAPADDTATTNTAEEANAASELTVVTALAKTPVYTSWLQTMPYRVVFSQTWADTLFVSLPCEERVVTLRAPSRLTKTAASAPLRPLFVDATCVGSLALPRGVVPLELTELPERNVVAVGTYEHGVLLCAMSGTTAAVEAILRTVPLAGHGSAVFPVCKMAALVPAPLTTAPAKPRRGHAARDQHSRGGPLFFPWAAKAEAVSSSAPHNAALLVSSPYELCPTLLKLSDNRSGHGRREDFPLLPTAGQVLSVGLFPVAPANTGGRLAIADAARLVSFTPASGAEAMDESVSSVSGHLPPALQHRVMYRHSGLLVGLADSPAVCYENSYSYNYANKVKSYTPNYIRHLIVAVDGTNEILLLDRKAQSYTLLSSFPLRPLSEATVGVDVPPEGGHVTSRKRPRTAAAAEAKPRSSPRQTTAAASPVPLPYGLTEPDELTQLCTGSAVIAGGNGWLSAAASHDQRFVSLVVWKCT